MFSAGAIFDTGNQSEGNLSGPVLIVHASCSKVQALALAAFFEDGPYFHAQSKEAKQRRKSRKLQR